MSHSSKPPLSFELGANHLHGVLRVDDIRRDTLVQLVQHWGDEESRDDIIDALTELAYVVRGVAREGELDAAIQQIDDVAGMETAHIEIGIPDVRRLLAELTVVERVTSRFLKTAAEVKRPVMRATRQHAVTNRQKAGAV